MNLNITSLELKKYLCLQINNLIPDKKNVTDSILLSDIENALDKCDFCFKHINNNAFCNKKRESSFSYLHADQYAMFLVYLSNNIWLYRNDKEICDKIMYLNRVLHSFMMSYKAKVPDIFWLAHPVGSVIGNADYSDYLYISQNCTINTAGNSDELKPHIGKFFAMGAGAALIGDKDVGDNCSIGVNAMVYNTELKDNSIVISDKGEIKILHSDKPSLAQKLFYKAEV